MTVGLHLISWAAFSFAALISMLITGICDNLWPGHPMGLGYVAGFILAGIWRAIDRAIERRAAS